MQPLYVLPCLSSPPRVGDSTAADSPPNPHPRRDRTGETVRKRYQLTRRLGSGTFGDAYLARDRQLKRSCVLKFCPSGEMIEAEALALAEVSHPNVAMVFDSGTLREGSFTTSYLVMEYVNGGDLLGFAKRFNLNHRQRIALYVSAAKGVDAIHGCGLVHCDLKPSNVLVHARSGQAKVIDLGLARTLSGRSESRTNFFGTPQYAAPEQFDSELAVGAWTDVYALGVILFELLTGRHPYALPDVGLRDSREAVEQAQTDGINVGSLDPPLNAALTRVVRAAMHKIPEERPTVRQLIQDLRSLISQ
jgi:serine/threonine-protein kinase